MQVLIIGSGGREHALAWKVAQSPKVTQVFVAPGNAGTAIEPKVQNIAINVENIDELALFANNHHIDLTIVGPEIPLVLGVVNVFREKGLRCFGPTQNAAQLEGSKAFTKDFLARHHIPTAEYQVFTEIPPALDYLKSRAFPIVIKADGLAAGKGVIIAQTFEEAKETIEDMLDGNSFGDAGRRVVIEEFLIGEEASFICMVDGDNVLPLATSQDHKARDDGDLGPNTGGMGAYSPAPVITPEIHQKIMKSIIYPTVRGMAAENNPYTGFLYAGLMIDSQGNSKVLEYNCRFGDPETQPIMMRLKSDLVDLCNAALEQKLSEISVCWDERASIGVVLAAGGYPNDYEKGLSITLPSQLHDFQKIFHAGTAIQNDQIVTNGGRGLCACALGENVSQAQKYVYDLIQQISWKDMFCRRDIGHRAIAREK